ncbi:MAG: DUF2975 domain-containing protein [Clostridia bacterium]|nr:DUF2975 domain-containing protein [Clostridia bacterium]
MQKLSKTASLLDGFLKIGFWCVVILIGFSLVLSILGLCIPTAEFMEPVPDLTLDSITFTVADDHIQSLSSKANALLLMATGLLGSAYLAYVLYTLRRILAPMIDGKPFHETVTLRLKRLSWVTLIGGGILSILATVYDYILLNMYDLDALFLSDGIVNYEVVYRTDLSFVTIFLALRLLTFIFRYGAELQQQADETL